MEWWCRCFEGLGGAEESPLWVGFLLYINHHRDNTSSVGTVHCLSSKRAFMIISLNESTVLPLMWGVKLYFLLDSCLIFA